LPECCAEPNFHAGQDIGSERDFDRALMFAAAFRQRGQMQSKRPEIVYRFENKILIHSPTHPHPREAPATSALTRLGFHAPFPARSKTRTQMRTVGGVRRLKLPHARRRGLTRSVARA
jgi:hypothetical protein